MSDTPLSGLDRKRIGLMASLLERGRPARIRETLQVEKVRPDDLAALVAILPTTHNPQPDPARRTLDGFKEYLSFVVRTDGVSYLIRDLPDLFQAPDFETIFAEPLEQYRSGLRVSTFRLLRAVEAAQNALHAPPVPGVAKRQMTGGSSKVAEVSKQEVELTEEERQVFLEQWGSGVAEAIPKAGRKALRRALQQGTSVPADAVKAMRNVDVSRPAKPRAPAPVTPAPARELACEIEGGRQTQRTPTEFTTRLCRFLANAGRNGVRIALVKQPLSWAAKSFPEDFINFQRDGEINSDILERLAQKLRVT